MLLTGTISGQSVNAEQIGTAGEKGTIFQISKANKNQQTNLVMLGHLQLEWTRRNPS
jgi:hypothetical protein